MILFRLLPAVLSLLLLAAHGYRSVHPVLMLACIALLACLWVRRPWVARTLQIALLLGSLEWLRTTVVLVIERNQAHVPFVRLALILGTVTVLTALSSLVLRQPQVRAYFGLGKAGKTDAIAESGTR